MSNGTSDNGMSTPSSAARDAALRWVLRGAAGRAKCTLPPWDQNTFFDIPLVSQVTVPISVNGGTAQLCMANPMRVGLIVATISALLHILPSADISFSGPFGIVLDKSLPPISITHYDYGPLVAMEWWVSQAAASQPAKNVTVFEIVLNRWPKGAS